MLTRVWYLAMPDSPSFQAGPATNRRRSQRVLVQVPLTVYGLDAENQSFREDAHTQVVNAHGALITLAANVRHGKKLVLMHKGTREEQEGRIVFLGPKEGGKTQVGIEFTRPAPHFWRIDFPPTDWKPVGE